MERVVVEIPEGADAGEVALLLRDALSDFQARRGPDHTAYVAERYEGQSESFRERKLEGVRRRCELARQIRVRHEEA